MDIPFPRKLRDILVDGELTNPHQILTDSGCVTCHAHDVQEVVKAVQLTRLSYLQKVFRRARHQSLELKLDALLTALVPGQDEPGQLDRLA